MTPHPKDPRFIIHDVPAYASKQMKNFYDEFLKIQENAKNGKWQGITNDNFIFEYSTYDRNAKIIFKYTDKNEHTHKITASLFQDAVSSACWFSYILKADNFAPTVKSVQSYAECLMLK